MAYEITVGPAQLTINVGECVLTTGTDGQVRQPSDRGLFFRDTRLLSGWTVEVNGRPWTLLSSAATCHFAAQAVLTNPALPTDDGELPQHSISLTLSRTLGLGGLRETLALRNHNRTAARLVLTVQLRCDFADIFDVKAGRIVSRGNTASRWFADEGRLETMHANGSFRRGVSVCPADGSPKPELRDGALSFTAEMAPQGAWTAELLYQVIDGEQRLQAPRASFAKQHDCEQAHALAEWRSQAMRLRTPCAPLQQLYDQSLDDLAALRLPIEGTDATCFVPAAGIPWFAALFGRDSLITALQTVAVYPAFARGALEVLAQYQADGTDDSRDMQPGKIPHELRRGELSELGLGLYRPYYGTADATALYLVLLHEVWRLTGNKELLEKHLETAERCLQWINNHGDMDGDGFQEYQRRTPGGAENQGWKDSGNAILYEDGENVPAPKATCELQGYVYAAWLGMAAIFEALGQPERADSLRAQARALYDRFNAAFWDEEQQFYALCLDPAKRRVMSIASNPGHLLWSGIVPPERAEAVVRRLLAPDMWSGWGVRTLSAAHPAYNPHDYQLGAIWPHDNGLIALGFKRYGFGAEAAQVAKGLVDAGSRFLLHRLPEVFAGTSREDSPFPVQYLGANVPQAWAAGSVFHLVRALLGSESDIGNGILHVDPVLPEWLPELRVEGLTLGKQRVDVHVWRENNETHAKLMNGKGIRLVRRPSVQAAGSERPSSPAEGMVAGR